MNWVMNKHPENISLVKLLGNFIERKHAKDPTRKSVRNLSIRIMGGYDESAQI